MPSISTKCMRQATQERDRVRQREIEWEEKQVQCYLQLQSEYDAKLKQLLIKYSLFRWANRMRMKNEKQKLVNSHSFNNLMLYVQTVGLRERISAIDAIWELTIARWTLNLMRHLVGCRVHNFIKHRFCGGDHFFTIFFILYFMICGTDKQQSVANPLCADHLNPILSFEQRIHFFLVECMFRHRFSSLSESR